MLSSLALEAFRCASMLAACAASLCLAASRSFAALRVSSLAILSMERLEATSCFFLSSSCNRSWRRRSARSAAARATSSAAIWSTMFCPATTCCCDCVPPLAVLTACRSPALTLTFCPVWVGMAFTPPVWASVCALTCVFVLASVCWFDLMFAFNGMGPPMPSLSSRSHAGCALCQQSPTSRGSGRLTRQAACHSTTSCSWRPGSSTRR